MTIPEYDEECDCEFCKEGREKRKMTSSSEQPKEYIITEEEVELIEDFLVNVHCQKCPYEGGGIKSGIKAFLRSHPHPAPPQGMTTDELWDYSNDLAEVAARKAREDENDRVLTSLVQELAGTWRMRDQKLFAIIRKYRLVPIGAMKNTTPHTEQEQPR